MKVWLTGSCFPLWLRIIQINHETAFTVSIDYKDTTTGISAEERGLTARMCVTENVNPFDFRRPGHMFPLIAKNGGLWKEMDIQKQRLTY